MDFDGLINRLKKSKERIIELEDMSNRIFSNWNIMRKMKWEKTHKEYIRTVGQLQNV